MYLNFRHIIKIFCALVLLSGCTKVIDIPIPNEPTRQVLSAYFVQGDTLKVLASKSMPVTFEGEGLFSTIPAEATVLVYENDVLLDTLQPKPIFVGDTNTYIYVSNQVAKANASYKVVATHPTLITVTGADKIPQTPTFNTFKVDRNKRSIDLILEHTGSVNYYLFECKVKDFSGQEFSLGLNSTEPNMQVDGGDGFIYSGAENTAGLRLFLKIKNSNSKPLNFTYSIPVSTTNNNEADFVISHISESYYLHEISKATQDPIIPLFPESSKLYSNIINGHGAITCASKTKINFTR